MKHLRLNLLERLAIPLQSSACGAGLVLALLVAALPIRAAQVFIVLRPGGTGWKIVEAEKITFNQKDKLRAGSGQTIELRPEEYKKLPQLEILRAGILRRHAGGYLVRRGQSDWEPVAADGAPVKTAISFATLWASTAVAIQTERNSKTSTSLQPAEIYAIIPGTDQNEAVAGLIAQEANFRGLGEANEEAAFEERMSALIALAPSVTGQGAARLQQVLLTGMMDNEKLMSSGIAQAKYLTTGLKYAAVSEKAYPTDQQQRTARDLLIARRKWLDQRMAILNALKAGELWDAFLNKYSDFQRWDNSFEDLRKSREEAFQKSGMQHYVEGQRYYADKNYAMALREANVAHTDLPSDPKITSFLETVKLDEERQTAAKRTKVVEDKTSASYRYVTNHLLLADNFINDGKLTEATREIELAKGADPESPRILYSRAKLQLASHKLREASGTIDDYSRQVVDDGGKGDELRTKIAYELSKSLEQKKTAVREAEAAGDYVKAFQDATDGLALDDHDLDFLLSAGFSGAILRKKADASEKLEKYISLAQAPGADRKRLADAYRAQAEVLKATLPQPEGRPNWFSAYNSPPGLAYCPISLMPNAHVSEVKAKKQTSVFQWNGDQLVAIHTTSQDPTDKASDVYFDYFKDRGGVRRVASEPFENPVKDVPTLFTEKGTVGAGASVYLGLPNHPVVDPLMIERLTGKRVATIVAGNPYFHPFVWSGVHAFLAEYDDQGRVKSARQISPGNPGSRTLDFKWDGSKLMEVAERGGDYRRTMVYSGNKLASETIALHGKSSKIEYIYKGEQLSEAKCGEDLSIDNRSRIVTFR